MTDDRLQEAARETQCILLRVAGEDASVLERIVNGDWGSTLAPKQADDLADLLTAAAEAVRHTRSVAGCLESGDDPHPYARTSVSETVDSLLPLNRKERYYTGTVLPMIVASDGFVHLHRLLSLCGLPPVEIEQPGRDGLTKVEFTTEYSFAESRFTEQDKARFPNAPTDADTPDVVIAGPDWLLAIEAKVFHNPLPEALNHQMKRQQVLVDYWTTTLGISPDRVRHVLLLPAALPVDGVAFPVVTWESVLAAYQVVGPAHWTATLATALDRYDSMVSRSRMFGENADGHLTGQEIVNAHAAGTLEYPFMGRGGGLQGAALAEDVLTGKWRVRRYEVRQDALPGNPNWFNVLDFITVTAHHESTAGPVGSEEA